jgi:hypothetical protein
MKTIPMTITNPNDLRAAANDPRIESAELYPAESNGHKYAVGEIRTLTDLTDFPEYNGEQVKITAIRKDGFYGKAYYIEGRINEILNWVYEYRLI